ncbi:MAG: DUF1028 domain-containing protein, partial [Bradyrhizobium sp.]
MPGRDRRVCKDRSAREIPQQKPPGGLYSDLTQPWECIHFERSSALTYTVIARCPRRGELGVAIATYSLAVGGLCPQIASSIGAMSSQAFVNPELRPLAINLLSAGRPAASALDGTMQSDPLREFRQVGI